MKAVAVIRQNWTLSRAERPWHSNWFLLVTNAWTAVCAVQAT